MKETKIHVRYYGFIREKLERSSDQFTFQHRVSMEDLISCIIANYGKQVENLFFNQSVNKKELNVLITKNKILTGADEELDDRDEVALIPIMSGG